MLLKVKKLQQNKEVSLKDFADRMNKVLLIRNSRGVGDILNCRMLFKEFKRVMPDMHLTFACYKEYHELLQNHPFLDDIADSKTVEKDKYGISYDISTTCIYYESAKSPIVDKHRADIWAEHCGIQLIDHDMAVPFIEPEVFSNGYVTIKQLRQVSLSFNNKDGPSVLISPFAYEINRTLQKKQLVALVSMLRRKGLFVYAVHTQNDPALVQLSVPILTSNLSEWMSYIHAADYVVSVDTSTFHYAGGIGKPLVGIFTSVDGKLRGKYYDFILVQKHRDNDNWPCGPCYAHSRCTNQRCKNPEEYFDVKPCLTELTADEMEEGVDKMLRRWPI
jgi:ADP-heptose:LPS heptosyltransferase